MKPKLNRVLLGLAGAVGAALLAVACSQPGALPVSPSSAAPSVDGSAVKGMVKFCAYIRAHERNPIYVTGQDLVGWRLNAASELTWEDSPEPHGLTCFWVPDTAETLLITIVPDFRNAAGESYCDLHDAEFTVHRAASTIWLYPDDGTHPDCHYEAGPY